MKPQTYTRCEVCYRYIPISEWDRHQEGHSTSSPKQREGRVWNRDPDDLIAYAKKLEDEVTRLRARVEELEEALGRACMDLANEADTLRKHHTDNLRAGDSARRIQAIVDRLMPLRALTDQEGDDG